MSFTSRGILADAASLWRGERELLLPLIGLFFVVPMFGAGLLFAGIKWPAGDDPQKLYAALMAAYTANLPLILAINLVFNFGSFAVYNLYLQGGGRTLGEVLLLSLRRFPFFFLIVLASGLLFSLGFSLFVLPGLFVLARTWLAGPAYAAEPEKGIVEAFRQGWVRSRGLGGIALLAVATTVMAVSFGVTIVIGGILVTLAGLSGSTEVMAVVSALTTALIGGAAWAGLAVVAVAAYRLGDPRQGT